MPIFKSIKAYMPTSQIDYSAITEEALTKCKYVPCTPSEESRFGWEKLPTGELFYKDARYIYLSAKKETKLLPAEVVKEEVANRVEEFEEKKGKKVSKVEKQSIKDDVIQALLPRAFSKLIVTNIIIDTKDDLIFVDVSSEKKAEDALALLRKTLGSLPVMPIAYKQSPSETFVKCIFTQKHPEPFTFGSDIKFTDGDREVVVKNVNLFEIPETLDFVETESVEKVLLFSEEPALKFSIDAVSTISGLKLGLESEKQDSPAAQFASDFAIFAPAYSDLFSTLTQLFGGRQEVETK